MSLITSPSHAITLGGLRLMQAGHPAVHSGFTLDVSKDGSTWGNPQVVISALITELSDGDIVTQTRAGNREPVLYVRISADTHAGLIAGDTALSAVVGPPCELTWQNPDPAAPLTVIDVVHSRMDHAWDDWDALNRRRVWIVTMSALPWPRSATQVITPAVATAAIVVVNSGSATTGWFSTNGTVTVVSGAVVTTYEGTAPFPGSKGGTNLTLTGVVSTNPEHYVGVDWKSSVAVDHTFRVSNQGTALLEVRREPAPTAGYTRSWYHVPDASITDLSLRTTHTSAPGSQTLSIDQVIKAATLPVSGSVKQIARTVDPDGNVAAEGTVLVQHATAGLGQTIVYSHPTEGGYSPALRPWLLATDTVTADAGSVSGFRNAIGGIARATIPVPSVPKGDVQLWVRLHKNSGGAGTVNVTWTARSAMNALFVGPLQTGTTACFFAAQDTWYLFPLARLTLPTTSLGPAGFVLIELQATGTFAANTVMDEAWLFAMDKGRLTALDCGTGTPSNTVSNRLRIAAPSLEQPFGSIEVATAADWSDAFTPDSSKVQCDQTGHRFDPDGSMIHVVTAGPATESSVSFEHYPRWRAEAG